MTKGTRLPEDMQLPEDWKAWAIAERPDLNINELFEEFRDYWTQRKDKIAWKISWLKTWRNWVRRQAKTDGRPMSQQVRQERLPDRKQWHKNRQIGQKQIAELRVRIRGVK